MTEECLKLTDRLRGIYTFPVNDGCGPLDGKMTYTPETPFHTPRIQKEAADFIEALQAKLARYEKALRFYANEKNHGFVSTGQGELDFDCPIMNDRGQTAREALEAKE